MVKLLLECGVEYCTCNCANGWLRGIVIRYSDPQHRTNVGGKCIIDKNLQPSTTVHPHEKTVSDSEVGSLYSMRSPLRLSFNCTRR